MQKKKKKKLGGDLIQGWKSRAWKYYFLAYWLAALQAAVSSAARLCLISRLKRGGLLTVGN